jgi:glycolate oxidase FAD binding subunit
MNIETKLQQQLLQAVEQKTPVAISAGHSKDFYGRTIEGDDFSVAGHSGIVDYDFRELVITARAGTRLLDIQQVLDDNNQMLPFEPPVFNEYSTLGGTVACGFSGPRRAYAGSARDFVLGSRILNGKAELLSFGGQVMKNVAGYDLSRVMAGSLGTLGVLLQLSLKVLPKPESEVTLMQQLSVDEAIQYCSKLALKNIPLSASVIFDGKLYLRFSGIEKAVQHVVKQVGGEVLDNAAIFWQQINNQQHSFFSATETLWRLSVPQATPELGLKGNTLYEWGGAQRWFIANDEISPEQVFEEASLAGGHACQFKNGERQGEVFQPLPAALLKMHHQLKNSLDPSGILNSGRMYKAF